MSRQFWRLSASLAVCLLICTACHAQHPQLPEATDPAEAAKDPDFKTQGEYVGEGAWPGGDSGKVGAQVIALSKGEFTVVLLKGGLPGEGWKRSDAKITLSAKKTGDTINISGEGLQGTIAGDKMTIQGKENCKLELTRTERHSSTEGRKAPEGAVVLFDGSTAENFENGHLLPDGNLLSEVTSKRKFGDCTIHLEFRLSYMPEARGQARSNSGVYLHDCYETQVLDSFGLEGADNECGGFYQLRKPDVNMCYPPLAWQTYDVDLTAPRYKDGKKVSNARVSIRQNGVVIHEDFELPNGTPGRDVEGPAPRPLHLQGHGNKVEYRNIWVVEKK